MKTFKFGLWAMALAAAYMGGVTTSDVLARRLSNNLDVRRAKADLARQSVEAAHTVTMFNLNVAHGDDLPYDRIAHLRGRMVKDAYRREARGSGAPSADRSRRGNDL